MIEVSAIPAFTDNYFWAIHAHGKAVLVDPGDAAPVLDWLARTGNQLTGILLTHHHSDHIGGVPGLLAHRTVPVIGHAEDAHRLPPLSAAVRDGDEIAVPGLDLRFSVIATPGHTLGHICYHGEGLLFCGDTLFSAGCGRMFEGEPAQFHQSLRQLAALPPSTRVFAAHEYTVGNLVFAAALQPDHVSLAQALAAARAQRAQGLATLPSTIGWERQHNPFLRCEEPVLAAAVGLAGDSGAVVFAAVRRAKDVFRSA